MHKQRVNELKLHIVIEPAGPLLIKSGEDSSLDPTLPKMSFVRTQHSQTGQRTIYLPGASLKGVIRSHSERIIRTVFQDNPRYCCDPLAKKGNCQKYIEKREIEKAYEQYKVLCLACRIFGNTVHASHFLAADAYPTKPINRLPVRHNVAIDRLSGGVAGGPFDMEVALQGSFHSTLMLYNFELWQVGLLALTLRDIAEGRVRIGFAKSRGLGEVKLFQAQLEIGYPGQFGTISRKFDEKLYGVGSLVPNERKRYRFVMDKDVDKDTVPYSTKGTYDKDTLWGRPSIRFGTATPHEVTGATLHAANEEVTAVLGKTVSAWATYCQARRKDSS